MSARSSAAWLLPLSGGCTAAVGFRDIFHLLPECPAIFPLPLATPAAPGVILWRDRSVAVLDLGQLMGTYAMQRPPWESPEATSNARLAALAAWMPDVSAAPDGTARAPQIGALLLTHAPKQIQVDDDQTCAIPEDLAALGSIICSCFEHHEYGSIPIIDLPRLFGQRDVGACPACEAQRMHFIPPAPHP